MAYQMASTAVTLNDLEGYSPVAGLFKCNPSNICAAYVLHHFNWRCAGTVPLH